MTSRRQDGLMNSRWDRRRKTSGCLRRAVGLALSAGPAATSLCAMIGVVSVAVAASALEVRDGAPVEGFVIPGGVDAASAAGDLNGDGIDDLLLSATNVYNDRGAAWVIFGSADGFPPSFDRKSLLPGHGGDGSRGFVLQGARELDNLGNSVSGAHEINGDGLDDVIIGASFADGSGRHDFGETYVLFGRTSGFPALLRASDLFPVGGGDGAEGFVIRCDDVHMPGDSSRRCGSQVNAGDINGDGLDDVFSSSARTRNGEEYGDGESYLIFGRGDGYPPVIQVASLFPVRGGDGTEGFVVDGNRDSGGHTGSGAGDVNDDGIEDFVIADTGTSYVIFGRHTGFAPFFAFESLLPAAGGDGSEGFAVIGPPNESASKSVSAAGDVNGDGVDDVIVGMPQSDPGSRQDAGTAVVIFGRTGGFPPVISVADLLPGAGGDGSDGFVITGTESDQVGFDVSTVGDLNGDGIDDLLIAAPRGDEYSGAAYVVFGRATGFPAVFHVADLLPAEGGDGSEGVVLRPPFGNLFFAGRTVGGIGDINADGLDDLIVAGSGVSPMWNYVIFGQTGFPAVIELEELIPPDGG